MALLTIEEFVRLTYDPRVGVAPIGEEPAIATQVVDFTAGEATSAEFNAGTNFIAISSDTAGHFLIGAAPTALAATSPHIHAGGEIFRGLLNKEGAGSGLKLSVIQ